METDIRTKTTLNKPWVVPKKSISKDNPFLSYHKRHMKRHIPIFIATLLLLTAVIFTAACTEYGHVSRFQHIPGNEWDNGDTISFRIDTLPRDASYEMSVVLRMNEVQSYPFRHLYLEVWQQWDKPSQTSCDTICCSFFDENDEPEGQGISLKTHVFPLRQIDLLHDSHGYIRIRHVMLRPVIEGVSDIGIELVAKEG